MDDSSPPNPDFNPVNTESHTDSRKESKESMSSTSSTISDTQFFEEYNQSFRTALLSKQDEIKLNNQKLIADGIQKAINPIAAALASQFNAQFTAADSPLLKCGKTSIEETFIMNNMTPSDVKNLKHQNKKYKAKLLVQGEDINKLTKENGQLGEALNEGQTKISELNGDKVVLLKQYEDLKIELKSVGDKDKSVLVIENNGLKAELEKMKLEMEVLKQKSVEKAQAKKSVPVVKSDFRIKISKNIETGKSEISRIKTLEVLPEKINQKVTIEPTGDIEMKIPVISPVNEANIPNPEHSDKNHVFNPTQKSGDTRIPETPEITTAHISKPKTTEAKFFEKISQKSAVKPAEKPAEISAEKLTIKPTVKPTVKSTEKLTKKPTEKLTETVTEKTPKPPPAVPQLKLNSSEKSDRATPTPPLTNEEPRLKPPSFQKPAANSRKEKKYLQEGGDKLLYKKRLEKLKNSLIPEFHQYAELLLQNEETIDNVEFCIMDYTFEEAGRRSELNGSVSKKPKITGNDSRQ